MFDIGWTELLVVAVVMILVVGPKDLPRMLRTFGQTIGKVRRMAGEFQSTFNEALREAEQQADIADMKKQVEKAANFDPLGDIKKSIETDRKPPKPAEAKPADTAAAKPADEAGGKSTTPAGASETGTGPAPQAQAAQAAAAGAPASKTPATPGSATPGESGTANTASDRTA
ncbi:Sec-independent protein translocase protein TatB [Stappia indica]|uniref:Sec-independent protein translocase protein TatB n=1 Tax=Stappia indica TaxID=538381 RepID=A0A857C453_9HYPH|nr:Sec-independent protein translocase protein TatB [Stappia indica]QGZ33382.1 twin-arginine translocase subunit TatB [Stappia indica]